MYGTNIRLETETILRNKPEAINQFSAELFPNPAANECTIVCNGRLSAGAKVFLYDFSGKLINSYSLSGHDRIPLSGLAPGVYQCRIVTEDGAAITRKLVVIK